MAFLTPINVTLGAAKSSVARVTGSASDSDQLAAAGEHIRDTITMINNKRNWRWSQNSTTLNVTTDGLVALPSRLKHIYSVVIDGRPMINYKRRHLNKENPYDESLGGTYYYDAYNQYANSQVELIEPPTANVSATVNYLTLVTIPGADNSTFADIPEWIFDAILCEARARYLADKGGSDLQLTFWTTKARETLSLAVLNDQKLPDYEAEFKSMGEDLSQYAPNPIFAWDYF